MQSGIFLMHFLQRFYKIFFTFYHSQLEKTESFFSFYRKQDYSLKVIITVHHTESFELCIHLSRKTNIGIKHSAYL